MTAPGCKNKIIGGMPTLHPVPLLTYAAAFSSRLKLGTSVMLTPLRSPVPLAKSLATLDQLSKGRLILGVGLGGHTNTAVYHASGISPRVTASRLEESIQVMKKLWAEDEVTFKGRFWQLDGISVNPKPLQKPHIPIWFGVRTETALKRAARMGDGWMGAGVSTTSAFKDEIKLVRQLLVEEGRDPATFPLSKRVYVAVDRDKKRVRQKLQEWFGLYYRNAALGLNASVYGSEEECIEGLAEIVSEDLNMLMLNPVYDMMEQAERLARDVLPKLQS